MKFLTQGHAIRYYIIMLIMFSLLGILFTYAASSSSSALPVALFFLCSIIFLIYGLFTLISFVTFSEEGIVEKGLFKKTVSMRWSECVDIRIHFAYEGARGIVFTDHVLPDGDSFSLSQMLEARKKGRVIAVNFTDKIWEGLMQYIPIERVRNAHLSEKHSYFYYLRYRFGKK